MDKAATGAKLGVVGLQDRFGVSAVIQFVKLFFDQRLTQPGKPGPEQIYRTTLEGVKEGPFNRGKDSRPEQQGEQAVKQLVFNMVG